MGIFRLRAITDCLPAKKKYLGNLIAELSFASALPVYLAMIAHFYVFSLPTQHKKRCLIHGDMMFEHDWKIVYMLLLDISNFCYVLFELNQIFGPFQKQKIVGFKLATSKYLAFKANKLALHSQNFTLI